jgi:glycosyltransferase involved in cell wall biosynthesis
MEKIPASVCILTRNSDATLGRALESVKEFDDIVISDGGSTDDTLAIARTYGARLFPQDVRGLDASGRIVDYARIRNCCVKEARHDWVLYIDSDESASKGLVEEIRNIVAEGSEKYAYRIPLRIMLDGREIKYSSNYPGWQTRFFRRSSSLSFIKPVHERLDITVHDARVGECKNPWFTYWTRDYARHYLRYNMKYVRLQAESASRVPLGQFLRENFIDTLYVSTKVIIKTFHNYLLHGTRHALPLSAEFGRALVPIVLSYFTLRIRLQRMP